MIGQPGCIIYKSDYEAEKKTSIPGVSFQYAPTSAKLCPNDSGNLNSFPQRPSMRLHSCSAGSYFSR